MIGDIDDLIRSNQEEKIIISDTVNTLIDSALDVADLSQEEGVLSEGQKKAIEGLEAGLVKLIKSDIVLDHNITSLRKIREQVKARSNPDKNDEGNEEDEISFQPIPEPNIDQVKEHPKYKEFYKKVWKKDLSRGGEDGGSDDDDDDLAVVGNQVSLICPITKKTFVNPVKK